MNIRRSLANFEHDFQEIDTDNRDNDMTYRNKFILVISIYEYRVRVTLHNDGIHTAIIMGAGWGGKVRSRDPIDLESCFCLIIQSPKF